MASARHTFTNEVITTLKLTGGDVDDPQDMADLTDGDNVTAQSSPTMEGYAGVYDKTLTFTGATNNATYGRNFRPAVGEGGPTGLFPGIPKYDGSVLALVDTVSDKILDLVEEYCQIQDISLKHTVSSAGNPLLAVPNSVNSTVVGLLSAGSTNTGAGQTQGILTVNGGSVDCLIADTDLTNFAHSTGTGYHYNPTSIGSQQGIVCISGTMNVKNGLSDGASIVGRDYLQDGGTLNLTTCGSSDASGSVGLQNLNFTYLTGANNYIPASDSDAIGNGTTNLSGDATYPFDDDVRGNTRTWGDLGFADFVAQEIDITGNGNPITNGSSSPSAANGTDFEEVIEGEEKKITYTIGNSGDANLTLTDSPAVVITGDTGEFTLDTDAGSPVTPAGDTTFIISFIPSGAGLFEANISIANNDDNEDPYTFDIAGTGISASDAGKLVRPLVGPLVRDLVR
jgi:hypothetical protein